MRLPFALLWLVLVSTLASAGLEGKSGAPEVSSYKVAKRIQSQRTLILNVSIRQSRIEERHLIALACRLMDDYVPGGEIDEFFVGVFSDFGAAKRFVGVHDDLPKAYKDREKELGEYVFNRHKHENYVVHMPEPQDPKSWKKIDVSPHCHATP
jgi:hypothetical protein